MMTERLRPGQVPGPVDLSDPDRFGPPADQPSMADLAWAHNGMPDMSALTPDPVPQRMSSGDHFSLVQFADQLGAVSHQRDEVPAVHRNPTTWYGTEPAGEGVRNG